MAFVIPFFIPHLGCPHQCLFCNQNSITGVSRTAGDLVTDISATIEEWLCRRKPGGETQFAFYGGSFTCLSAELQETMLSAVQPWLESGDVSTIRLSTRPDCIDGEVCRRMNRYGVGLVELGVQSLDDRVLEKSQRGHTAQDCIDAVHMLKDAAIAVGVQLMPGLPGESRLSFMKTVRKTISLQPDCARLYPALVVRGSGLEKLYEKGSYTPMSLGKAVVMVHWAKQRLEGGGIEVIRMGLQHSESLQQSYLAGPHHPAFGERVLSRSWLTRVRKLLNNNPGKRVEIAISPRDISAFNGQARQNIRRLEELGVMERVKVTVDHDRARGSFHYVVRQSA